MTRQSNHRVSLKPTDAEVMAATGTPLRQLLFEHGVEFPCGGQGRCRGCKIRVLSGTVPSSPVQEAHLSPQEIQAGWRLPCQCQVESDLVLEIRQWDAVILADDGEFTFTPQEGYGIAVDLGTTTLAAQLLDLQTARVLAVKTALNPQASCGTDVMSRVEHAVASGGAQQLTGLIREEIGRLIHKLLVSAQVPPEALRRVTVVGNTVMHHLFSGIDLEPMSHVPFEPLSDGLQTFSACDLGWKLGLSKETRVSFLPCLGGFVGSDILAGMLATGLAEREKLTALVDLGTNGEIVLGDRNGLLCASTAAGPAFEGARISMGMRAATGAIYQVHAECDRLACATLGGTQPTGICGSGLVDAVAAALDIGWVRANGRITTASKVLPLEAPVELTQTDIRQLQLAKGAIAAGLRILLETYGAQISDVQNVYLAGAFGNYVRLSSAIRIGLLPFPETTIHVVGNTALLGAKIALFTDDLEFATIRAKTRHLSLNADPHFQDIYVDEMGFPVG